jgi:predicted ArsR family transcriptional regulator
VEEADMNVLDAYLVDPGTDLLSKVKIQAQVLVPLVRALRAELGEDKANALVKRALRDWSAELFADIGKEIDGAPRKKWAAMHTAMGEISEQEVTVEMRRQDREALEFDITSCKFAEFFRALGEPELGTLLLCSTDIDIAAAGGDQVEFSRTQTIMNGAKYCNFRYRFAPPAKTGA